MKMRNCNKKIFNITGGMIMERHGFAMEVKEGQMNEYRKRLGEIWPELTGFLDRNGVKNFSIWRKD